MEVHHLDRTMGIVLPGKTVESLVDKSLPFVKLKLGVLPLPRSQQYHLMEKLIHNTPKEMILETW
jgi:hypothetical protein